MIRHLAVFLGLSVGLVGGVATVAAADGTPGVVAAHAKPARKAPKKKPTDTKKKRGGDTVDPGGDGGGEGGSTLTVTCWCSGGANGNGYASCLGTSCDNANSCCAAEYGEGSTAED